MITILFHFTVKAEREIEWSAMLEQLIWSSRADDGCVTYQYYQQRDSPREYVCHEQWRDSEAIMAHVKRLQREMGPAPERGVPLPLTLLDCFEQYRAVQYEPVG